MNAKLILFLLLILAGTSAMAEIDGVKKSEIPFTITQRSFDTRLNEKSQLVFTFTDGAPVTKTDIQYGMNDETYVLTINKNGKSSFDTDPGKYVLYFYLDGCFEIITDTIEIKKNEIVAADVHFEKAGTMITVDKPVIYLYPEQNTEVTVQMEGGGKLGFTWPTYNQGWKFTATPEGKIQMNGKEYHYLFYESDVEASALSPNETTPTGFLVATDTLLTFLENSLSQMGFTAAESADFITYWYPQMMENEANYIRFLFNDECNVYGELKISPAPDHIFRVGMLWMKADENGMLPEKQTIPTLKREGFSVVEWGGTEMQELNAIFLNLE